MNRIGIILLLALGMAACNAHALEARQTPYDKIAERNLFQLHAAPIVEPLRPTVIPPPKATLTGITTILGRRMAFITIEGTKAHPGESVVLVEGGAASGIEVKGIDEKAGTVSILNGGELQILKFEPARPSGQQLVGVFQMEVILDSSRSPVPQVAAKAKVEPSLSPEEQTALIELQRIKFQMEGNPAQVILPPTELNPNE